RWRRRSPIASPGSFCATQPGAVLSLVAPKNFSATLIGETTCCSMSISTATMAPALAPATKPGGPASSPVWLNILATSTRKPCCRAGWQARSNKRNKRRRGRFARARRLSLFQSRPYLRGNRDRRAIEIGDQPPDRIVLLNEALAGADKRVDIHVRDGQPGRDRLQTLALLRIWNTRQ